MIITENFLNIIETVAPVAIYRQDYIKNRKTLVGSYSIGKYALSTIWKPTNKLTIGIGADVYCVENDKLDFLELRNIVITKKKFFNLFKTSTEIKSNEIDEESKKRIIKRINDGYQHDGVWVDPNEESIDSLL